jgi:hypothetical protein
MENKKRQQILQDKLRANSQRNASQSYINALPPALSHYLRQCPLIPTSEADATTQLFVIHPLKSELERTKFLGYVYRTFSWSQELLEAVQSLGAEHDQDNAYFCPFNGNPLYALSFGWFRQNLSALFKYSQEQLGAIAHDGSFGLVISNYVGYLSNDPNPDEIVYELSFWGFSSIIL